MNCIFNWNTSVSTDTKKLTETKIKEDLHGHSPFDPCHEGELLITVSSIGLLNESIVGDVKCNTGDVLGIFKGASDGSEITYSANAEPEKV